MDLSQLISTIVRQVLEQLREGALPPSPAAIETARPCVMVLLAGRCDQLAARLEKDLDGKADIIFWGEDAGNRAPSRYILPRLACGEMAELAAGQASGNILPEVLKLLLAGKKVEVLKFEYLKYGQTAPGPLYGLYEGYKKTLAGYGLVEYRPKRPGEFRFRDSLVTEAAVNLAQKSGAATLLVPAAAIVTPLARDAAKSLSINIIKQL